MKKDLFIIIVIIIFSALMYALTLRGELGNPNVADFENNFDLPTKPFELSPERGRYVHVVNLAERGTYDLTKEWAEVAYPDVGIYEDKYYSFFAPGVPYAAVPFYLLGAKYGLGQVGAFSVEPIVSIITLVFIYLVARRIFKLPRWASLFSVLIYGFGSTSWNYAITLYQNAFTACLMITSFYAVWRFSKSSAWYSPIYAAYAWLAYALSITVDYPNALLMLPVMIYLAFVTFSIKTVRDGIKISVRWAGVITAVAFVAATGFHFWHNATYFGGWNKLAGTLPNYVRETVTPSEISTASPSLSSNIEESLFATTTGAGLLTSTESEILLTTTTEKTLVASFKERLMPNGFYILILSDERGLLYFTPIFIFSLFGIAYALRRKVEDRAIYIVPISLIALNLFLYSSWGDPWGGWAYGPRYLIPSLTWLSLFVGVALYAKRSSIMIKIIAFNLFLYSSAIALLGVLTTNAIPTKSEAMLLPIKTYNFLKNIPHLQEGRSGSFIYKTYLTEHITLVGYFLFIYITIAIIAATILIASHYRNE